MNNSADNVILAFVGLIVVSAASLCVLGALHFIHLVTHL